ncbi:putative uncharacterized protein C19orf81 homolog [Ranitomeya variabilis]|uniref:putative uncharacterized protein C19orf81 homolog n=1 Tax=Ranitomeya variabilis TaxID=490064 RepID=UPI0040569470
MVKLENVSRFTLGHATTDLPKRERHLKQIIHKYEELNPEKPLTRKFQNPPPSQLLTLCMESPVSRWVPCETTNYGLLVEKLHRFALRDIAECFLGSTRTYITCTYRCVHPYLSGFRYVKPTGNIKKGLISITSLTSSKNVREDKEEYGNCIPRDILKAIEHIVPKAFEKKQVSKIQIENTNVILGMAGRKNRWLIIASNFYIRDLLLHSWLEISGELFPLHQHDDVIIEDEKRNLRRTLNKNKILDAIFNPTNLSKIP